MELNQIESSHSKYNVYSDCLNSIFAQAKKVLSKKNPYYCELYSFLEQYKDKILQDQGKELRADRYLIYMKMSLDGDNNKISDVFIENMYILIKERLFIGDTIYSEINIQTAASSLNEEDSIKTSPTKQRFKPPPKLKPLIIDLVIDSIIKLYNENDEAINYNSINLIHLIVINSKLGIHEQSVNKILTFFFRNYLLYSKNSIKADNIKKILLEILKEMFKKMEETNQSKTKYIDIDSINSNENNDNDIKIVRPSIIIDFNQYNITSISASSNSLGSTWNEQSEISQAYDILINKIMIRQCKNIIDSISLYCAKRSAEMEGKIDSIPINQIPQNPTDLTKNSIYDKLFNPKIINEKGILSGNFGWCYICRNTANYYDNNTRKPICSYECKFQIEKEDDKLSRFLQGEIIYDEDIIGIFYLSDCLNVFKSLCKMVNATISKTDTINFKGKILSLDILYELINQSGEFLSTIKDFRTIIKEHLIENILTNCLSEDQSLFQASMKLFFKLWYYFRENLKQEIGVFNETVFLKILDSGNSSYFHKLCVLENFEYQASTPRYYIELYANYDCDLNEKFLVNRIISALGKIGQGKYLKGDHSLSPQQENNLRVKALKTISCLVLSLLNYAIDQIKALELQSMPNDDFDSLSEYDPFELNDIIIKDNQIDMNLKYKAEIEKGVEKFNIKYKNGLVYLKKIGIINKDDKDKEAKDTVSFLRNNPSLKKEFIGEILGENNEVCLKILKHYSESFDFSGLHIVHALREYLSTFLLPGEGQKIDRILESFSNKFMQDNQNMFEHPDCAYYLSFTIIILQTELHNPKVKAKMGFDGFLKLIRIQKTTDSLSEDYLKDIYNQILEKPISLPEFDEAKEKMELNKEDQMRSESQRVINECKEKLKHGKNKLYMKLFEFEYVTPLMSTIWSSLLAVFSVTIEETDDKILYDLCIEGMSNVIVLLSLVNLDFEKDAVIKSLCKVTNLFQSKEIKEKNTKCIKELLQLGLKSEVPYFKHSWKSVIEVLSRLDYLIMTSKRVKVDRDKFINEFKLKRKHSLNIDKEIQIEKNNMDLINKELTPDNYEQIFNRSDLFNNECIIDFLSSLCEATREEINETERIYLMQKLTEVTEMNMARNIKIWKKIWDMSSKLLIDISLNENSEIAKQSIDSLRRIVKKCLQIEEMNLNSNTSNYTYQNSNRNPQFDIQSDLFKPFELILLKSPKSTIRKDQILNCIDSFISSEGNIIYSGWEVIVNILSITSKDLNDSLVSFAFSILKKMLSGYLVKLSHIIPLLTSTLINFSLSFPEEVINWLSRIIHQIDSKEILLSSLASFSLIITDKRENIRTVAMKEMFNIIKKLSLKKKETKIYNQQQLNQIDINESFWNEITLQILIPLCDRLIITVDSSTLKNLVVLFTELMKSTPVLLKNSFTVLLELIKKMCVYQDDSISFLGLDTFITLLNQNEFDIIENYTSLFIGCVTQLFQSTLQKELFTFNNEFFNNKQNKVKYQEIFQRNKIYSSVQIKLLELWGKISMNYLTKLSDDELELILLCLEQSFEIAFKFNLDFNLDYNLRKNASWNVEGNVRVVMFKQQDKGISEYYRLLLYLIDSKNDHLSGKKYRELIMVKSISILKAYISLMDSLPSPNDEEIYLSNHYAIVFNEISKSIVEEILPALVQIECYKDHTYSKELNELFIQMVMCNVDEVRLKLKEIFGMLFEYNNLINIHPTVTFNPNNNANGNDKTN